MSEILLAGMQFDTYLQKHEIFGKTRRLMEVCLKNWYRDDPEQFQSDMRANLQTVLDTYRFARKIAAIEQNYRYEPPLDCLTASIDISDEADGYVAIYTAFWDFNGNAIDDMLTT